MSKYQSILLVSYSLIYQSIKLSNLTGISYFNIVAIYEGLTSIIIFFIKMLKSLKTLVYRRHEPT